jgi:hypothetical protein
MQRHAESYASMNARNGGIEGDYRWRGVTVWAAEIIDSQTVEVSVRALQGSYTVRDNPGRPRVAVRPQNYSLKITLAALGDRWVMFDMISEKGK